MRMTHVTDYLTMDKDRRRMTERILNLTLEIIYLLTGEDYIVVKKTSSEHETPSRCSLVSGGLSRTQNPIMELPPHSLIHWTGNDKKILELSNKIIQLLTGEEVAYLKEHKGLCSKVLMEKQPPLKSLDGSSNRNTPERCHRPLYTQNFTEENHRIPQEDQGDYLTNIKVEDTEGVETFVRLEQQSKGQGTDISTDGSSNRDTPERCPHPLYSQDWTEENHRTPQEYQSEGLVYSKSEYMEGEEEMYVRSDQQCKEEEIPTDNSTDGSSNRDTPERCPCPLYSQDCTEENHRNPQEYQDEYLTDIKVETIEEEEEMYMRGDQQWKEEEIPADISTDGHYKRNTSEERLCLSSDGDITDDITQFSLGENCVTPMTNPVLLSTYMSPALAYHEECSPDSVTSITALKIGNTFPCSIDQTYFKQITKPITHQPRKKRSVKRYPCSECEKSFTQRSQLLTHSKLHTGEISFPCAECGKCYTRKEHLVSHQRSHTGEKPFPCSECGKCFAHKSILVTHERRHTGEKPFRCSECGKCFAQKSVLVRHERCHTGEKPFACSQCGKCFAQKQILVSHERCHTGEKPFPCSQCGKRFAYKSVLVTHEKSHKGEKPFRCSECGKCFAYKSVLVTHEKSHKGEKPFRCSECGKCFTQKPTLDKHLKTHSGEKQLQ
ncbi:zinc finger protein 1 homolog [Pseudophryne corroboree]|uniref:zinc finger protein 1 homolog n=1 Tax=Pseudophryne corroboree TaxID=495146 RepID=UPI003081D32F